MKKEYVPILFPRWDNGEPVEIRFPKNKNNMVTIPLDELIKMQDEIKRLKSMLAFRTE